MLPLALLSACGARAEGRHQAIVFAAASLSACFGELGAAFEREHPDQHIELNFAGTPQLVMQVREGAPVDVFASADEANMQRMLDTGSAASAPMVFACNRLTIVVEKGNPKQVHSLADLAREDLRVALCGPDVPAGRYARQALATASVTVRSVSDEPSVKSVVSKVRLGEIDAGIVYVTDATAAQDGIDAIAIPVEHNVIARYPIARLGEGSAARTFVEFVLSADGQAILRRHGFSAP